MTSFIWGAFDIKSLVIFFFSKSISLNNDPITGFCASKLETPLNNKANGFPVLQTFFSIGSNFRLELASLCLPLVT